MQIKVPWLLSRRRLLVAVVLDSLIFAFLCFFFCWYLIDLSWLVFVSTLLLWFCWLLISYVMGRYSGLKKLTSMPLSLQFLRLLFKTVGVVILSLFGTLFVLLLFSSSNIFVLFNTYLVPFSLSLFFFGILVQFAFVRFLRSTIPEISRWSYLGSYNGYQQLLKELCWSSLPVEIDYLSNQDLFSSFNTSILVDDLSAESPATLHRLNELHHRGVTVLSRLSWCESILQRFPPKMFSEADFFNVKFAFSMGSLDTRIKRLGDVIVSAALMIVSFPVILLAAIFIKLEDGGPIFYSQLRTGLYGQPFTVWKLRSMRPNAEQAGVQWSNSNDQRVTRIGSVLRRSRLDELPQLWTVFSGRMSLIGPRPERPEFDQDLMVHIPHYRLRHYMRPGLSGWAQVNYPYGASVNDSANKLSYDLYYLLNFSIWLDILIFFKTIRLVLNARGSQPMS